MLQIVVYVQNNSALDGGGGVESLKDCVCVCVCVCAKLEIYLKPVINWLLFSELKVWNFIRLKMFHTHAPVNRHTYTPTNTHIEYNH